MEANQGTEKKERKPFKIEIEDHFDFDAIASSKFITSSELCKMVSELLRGVFADYEGCSFETAPGMEPTIALIFNHNDCTGSPLPVACERAGAKHVGNTIIDRTRERDNSNRNGDRYYLSEDGQDFVKSLICKTKYNNGNIKYRDIVSEVAERTAFQGVNTVYTKVWYIGIDRLCNLLFGSEEDGDKVEYMVGIAPININQSMFNSVPSYVLNITKVSAKEINNFCNKVGYSVQGLNIVR